jgi:hypothetical protein
MDAELLKTCNEVYTSGAKTVIKEAMKRQRDGVFACPVTGRKWAVADAGNAERLVCKAKIAQAWWEMTRPGWAPKTLPLNDDDIGELLMADDGDDETICLAWQLVAQFSRSLMKADYDIINHPGVEDWMRNVLWMQPTWRPILQSLNLTPKPMSGYDCRNLRWVPPPRASNGWKPEALDH